MRLRLTLKGKLVGYLAGGMSQKLVKEDKENPSNNVYEDSLEDTISSARKRLPKVDFDHAELVAEEALAKAEAELIAKAVAEDKVFWESDEGKAEIAYLEAKADEAAKVEAAKKAEFLSKRQNSK